MRRDSLYSIAPHAPFLETLAARVLDGTLLGDWPREGAFWLSDVTIILPTRRARLALAAELADQLGGSALLPDIRTFGGEVADEEPFLPPYDAPGIALAASSLERRLTLSHLVRLFAERAGSFANPPNAAEIFWLADSLGEVVDDFIIEGIAPDQLKQLVPESLAENWQQILDFLDVALKAWPAILAESGRIDAAAARNERLLRQAAAAPYVYGDRPVIAAGSTGSIPATAALLKAIAELPRGVLVLPGIDTTYSPGQHDMMLKGETTQSHPQYGLMKLLRSLDAGVGDVVELAGGSPRTTLVRAALAPANETPNWPGWRAALPVADALAGVAVLAARNADVEARAIALAARATLADGKTVGIVSRDQTLARRIAVELKRHGVIVDDAAGTPLYQSGIGRLARQVLAVSANDYAPVDTIALLRNAAVSLGLDRLDVRKAADHLDLKLRRTRPLAGLAGLHGLTDREEVRAVLAKLGEAMAPVAALQIETVLTAPDLAAALLATLSALAPDTEPPGLPEFQRWAEELTQTEQEGTPFPPDDLDAVLAALLAGAKAQGPVSARDDIHIWGELEARLQNPDLMILAGMNEDIWPAVADPGPWLSRGMRIGIGLEPPERQQGLAAHDFTMAFGNANVLIAYAERIGTSPALPSPLLQRIDAFIGEDETRALRARGEIWLRQADAIDYAGLPRPATRPMPNPPGLLRPRRLSITEIEPLMRSPYDIYAKHVLGLYRMEPLGTEPSARERGTMIHGVFEKFVEAGLDIEAPEALPEMMGMARDAFAGLDAIKERRDIWLKRFERAARQFLDYERRRDADIVERNAELKGEWRFPALDGFTLVGKADRLDVRRDGTLEIIDFKTGGVPQPKDMTAFDAPQLLLEAAMARAGVFPGLAPRDSSALTYIKIGLGPAAFQIKPYKLPKGMELMEAVGEIERRVQRHVDAFLLHDGPPMTARIRPRVETGRKSFPGDYDHLARTDEWTLTAGVDDP
ncbi:double-strand break repair protein AddB [Devosia sp. CN2-171]|uniref:double-strand break repair protein AddB n=1 Tax=Devosia sp. CN2-171 TaxID=3400909 RepID=UPI003BF78F34